MADDHDFMTVKAGHAANQGMVVGETAVAVDLAPVGKDPLHILQHERALRIPRQLRFLPRAEMRRHLSL